LPLGWECSFLSEIEPFPCAVLAQHYPNTPNLGDFTQIEAPHVGAIDLLIGGTPCQDFSVAGLRAGMGGERGKLTTEFVSLAHRLRPRWVVWENVPGVLSIDGGRAFGTFLGALGKCGYGFAYRVLDAQYFGVPQRRRRVFVVGYLGDWRRATAVLLEQDSLRGHSPPSRETRQIASALTANGVGAGGGPDDNSAQGNHLVAAPLTHSPYADNEAQESRLVVSHTLRVEGFDASEDGTGRGIPLIPVVAWTERGRKDGRSAEYQNELAYRLRNPGQGGGGSSRGSVSHAGAVRRLTPRECERLQGFPDDYTAVPYRGKPAADGPRYRALGNSMAVPVIKWLGERMEMVDSL
jgi:DNA (cytosine-5)-methyltransferase 1